MGWIRIEGVLGAFAAVVLCLMSSLAQASGDAAVRADFQGQRASPEARKVARWVLASRNAEGKPFAIVDKKDTRLFVFSAAGRLLGATPALLGSAVGDDSAPGVGQRVALGIAPNERTTPAGRFDSQPGHNLNAEAIVWVDYKAAVAIHRLRPAPAAQRRPERLASGATDDRRISLGCIVVSEAFYDEVVAPTLGRQHGVVYVLPETRDLGAVFGQAFRADL
jgi:hypothetical protein